MTNINHINNNIAYDFAKIWLCDGVESAFVFAAGHGMYIPNGGEIQRSTQR